MLDHVSPFLSLLASVLVFMPLAWHVKSRNVGTIVLSIWLILGNLDNFINSMVWWNTTANKAPGFCEISIRLRHALFVAIPASNLVIARKLESIASTRQVRASAADRKKSVIIDLLISVGVPVIYVSLMIVNQSNRYGIVEEAGCWPILVPSWVWVLLVAVPVVLISLCSAVYSVVAFRWFWIRRRQFQAVLASSASTINKSRYVRLLMLTAIDMLLFFPVYVGAIATEIKHAITTPYGSWSSVHSGFSQVLSFPAAAIEMQSSFRRNLILSRLVCPLSAYIFFAMFGLGLEARQGYKNAFGRLLVFFKLRKESKPAVPEPIVADIEVVTFQSHDPYAVAETSPYSEKSGADTPKYEDSWK
uniref:Pheromone receptor 1 n=1 Tax=Ustilago esculenta TaxID=185366 RepID=A0A0U2JD90_9BASI|nr:pheromone receptor 1 [Ustilago esculenta]QBH70111.1 pheromone receptor a1 [Ustilago esculenta]